jgi:hypothetical protein
VPKAWPGFVHALARSRFAVEAQPAVSDAKDHAATVRKRQSADQQVRPTCGRVDIITEVVHHAIPVLAVDERYLSAAALVSVANDTASGSKRCACDRVHRATVSALDPDCLDSTSCHAAATFRTSRSD